VDVEVEPVSADVPLHSDYPPAREMPVIGTFGAYDLFGRLAKGGMAEIFLARQRAEAGASRFVVLKRVLPEVASDEQFVRMFTEEARIAMRLSHPNICHIYEVGKQDESYFIAMEWVNGVSLRNLVRRARPDGGVPIPIAVKIISHIAEALHYAHRARDEQNKKIGLVHRDVSPQNIMVSYDGAVKLLDFGVAKTRKQKGDSDSGTVKGKFAYMSPQQCLGLTVDHRADIFGLGVCLFEALTGRSVYYRPTEFETMKAIVEEPVPSVRERNPKVPERLDAILKKAMAKDPRDRFETAGAMQTQLEEYLASRNDVVPAPRVMEYLEKLFAAEIAQGPQLDSTPFGDSLVRQRSVIGAPVPARVPTIPSGPIRDFDLGLDIGDGESAALPAVRTNFEPLPARRGRKGLLTVLAVLGIAAIGVGGFFALGIGRGTPRPRRQARVTHDELIKQSESGGTGSGSGSGTGTATGTGTGTGTGSETGTGTGTGTGSETGTGTGTGTGTEEETDTEAEVAQAMDPETAEPQQAPTAYGRLSINTRPWTTVYLNGRRLGVTPIGGKRVPAGTHRLRLVDGDGHTHSHTVRVPANGQATVSLQL